jgi:hypothetical protein
MNLNEHKAISSDKPKLAIKCNDGIFVDQSTR